MKATHPKVCRAIEALENRVLLSAAAVAASDGLTHSQLAHLYAVGKQDLRHPVHAAPTASNGILDKLDSSLLTVYKNFQLGSSQVATNLLELESLNGEPEVTVHARGGVMVLVHQLDRLGFQVQDINSKLHTTDGYLPVSALAKAAKLPRAMSITSIPKPIVHSEGVATDQAESAEEDDLARQLYGLTGAGVKIGVMSDSVSQYAGGLADSEATGDLPAATAANAVQVLQDGEPGDDDEGRAMLEELYDMAPGASFAFYSGDAGQQSMADGIRALQSVGCTVIVDDIGYSDEPFFQDGVISTAINSFVAAGGSYVSAIGNDGNAGYLRENVQYMDFNGSSFVNFAPTGQTPNQDLTFTITGEVQMALQWDNPYNGITGQATSELNLNVYNASGNQLVASSNTNTLVTGIPEQFVDLTAGKYYMQIQLAALAPGATAPDMFKFVAQSDGAGGFAQVGYPGIMSSAYGHGSGQYTISVGAVPFSNAPPFSTATPIDSETYSSTGPIVYAFDAQGNKLATPLTLDKPDVSGVDGINTSFFIPGDLSLTDPTSYPQFFGTSAAAPNVAAVVALIQEYHPGSTEQVILNALESSTTPLNGAAAGTWDPQGGYGLINAVKALNYFGSPGVTPVATFAPIASPNSGGIASEAITFNEAVSGLTLADLSLTLNNGPNLLTNAQTVTTTDGIHYTLNNLSTVTITPGEYILTLQGTPSPIVAGTTPLIAGASVTWQETSSIGSGPTVTLAAIASPQTGAISSETITFSEAVTGFSLANLSLNLAGAANLLTAAQTLTTTDNTTFTLGNLSPITAAPGAYVLTLTPTGITGGGAAMSAGGSVSWTVGAAAAPTVTLAPVTSPQTAGISSETITFNEAVTGFALANLSLTLNGGANLLTGAQTLTTSDNTTFTLNNLASITGTAGNYVLTLSPTGITGGGVAMTAGGSVSWTVSAAAAPTVTLAPIVSPQTAGISSETITFSEAVTGFTLANLSLTLGGGANLLTAAQTLTSGDQTTYTLNNLAAITTSPGTYTLTLSPTNIASGGVAMVSGSSISWTVT